MKNYFSFGILFLWIEHSIHLNFFIIPCVLIDEIINYISPFRLTFSLDKHREVR